MDYSANARRILSRALRVRSRQIKGPPHVMKPGTQRIIDMVRPFSMTSTERLLALTDAVDHVVKHQVPGAIVECGVWRGGSMMAVALTLCDIGEVRDLYLFDTFAGMTPPSDIDRDYMGRSGRSLLAADSDRTGIVSAVAPIDEVRSNMASTGYRPDRIHYVKGPVEETLPASAPESIALLRLDTDWYASTRHELVHLMPRVSHGGVLIVDDYGHFEGARKAVDEYLASIRTPLFLVRIDYTGRLAVIP